MDDLIFSKQPAEEFKIQANFSKNLASGEAVTLSTSTVTAVDNAGGDASDTILKNKALTANSDGLFITVQSGTLASAPYKITFLAVTDLGQKWELDVTMGIYT